MSSHRGGALFTFFKYCAAPHGIRRTGGRREEDGRRTKGGREESGRSKIKQAQASKRKQASAIEL
eukprot:1687504-Pyramimonas_sp.AAC.1